MATSFAVIGPGRVGVTLARRLHGSGFHLLGFLGRHQDSIERATRLCGGQALQWGDLRAATVVMLSVPDDSLCQVVAAAAAAAAPRRCSLWFHVSGFHPVEVLAPLQAHACRIGAMHPLAPFPAVHDTAPTGPAEEGRFALCSGDRSATRLLQVVARKAGFRPVLDPGVDRVRYHAACALSANGLTALADLVAGLFADLHLPGLHLDLMEAALRACRRLGAEAALTGPGVRGDQIVLAAHQRSLAMRPDHGRARAIYDALLAQALDIAVRRGALDPERARRLASPPPMGDDPPRHG